MAETVTVIRKPKRDLFGDRTAGADLQWEVPGWEFAPGPSQEMGAAGGQVETDATVYGPPVVDIARTVPEGIKPTDIVRVRGDDYEVVGRIRDWGQSGSELALKRVTG